MANTTVHVTTLTKNATTANPTGTAIEHANTHVITPTKPLRDIIIRIAHTTASAKSATIKAGDHPPALAAGQGDLSVTLADATAGTIEYFVGPLEAARFLQDDGTIQVEFDENTTGFVEAFQLP